MGKPLDLEHAGNRREYREHQREEARDPADARTGRTVDLDLTVDLGLLDLLERLPPPCFDHRHGLALFLFQPNRALVAVQDLSSLPDGLFLGQAGRDLADALLMLLPQNQQAILRTGELLGVLPISLLIISLRLLRSLIKLRADGLLLFDVVRDAFEPAELILELGQFCPKRGQPASSGARINIQPPAVELPQRP